MSFSSLLTLTATKALEQLKKREISARNLCDAYLAQIDNTRHLDAYVTETPDIARAAADAAAKRYKDEIQRPLEGLPFAHKDLFATKGILSAA